MCDMFFPADTDCFLARPEWKQVMRDEGRYLIYPRETPQALVRLSDDYFACLADTPAVLRRGFDLREANEQGRPIDLKHVGELIGLAVANRASFKRWYEDFTTMLPGFRPQEVLSEDPESPYAMVFRYEGLATGALHMSYWASMLILQETLIQCQWPEELQSLQQEFLSNILRSLEWVGQGPVGPFRVGYSIRIAYDFANAEKQHWIRGLLDAYAKKYAATDKATYPAPRIDNGGYA